MGRYHKETNRYRFQNFTERMKLMHIDVVHQIRKKVAEDDGEDSTYFGSALSKWRDLNCTQNFGNFKEDMRQCPCTTYVELVFHAESIIVILKKHLLIPNTLALEPLLDLLVQMGRDLGPDFCDHFKEVFEILIQVLNASAKDPDAIEKIFTTMAYLYKFLRKYLIKNIYTVYGYFSSLLTHDKEYIRRFAAESFAFLMRKVKDQDALIHFLFSDLEQNPQKAEGMGQLLFEVVKGVSEHFHTVSEEVFRCILLKLGPGSGEKEGRELPFGVVEETVGVLMGACTEYTNQQAAAQLWSVLLGVITEVNTACDQDTKEKDGSANLDHLCRLLRLTHIWLTQHKGRIVSDPSAVAKVLITLLKTLTTTATVRETLATDLLADISSLLLYTTDRLSVETTARLVSLVFSTDFTLEQTEVFSMSLFDSALFEKDVLPGLLHFMARRYDTAAPGLSRSMLSMMAEIVLRKCAIPEDGSQLTALQMYPLDFSRMHRGVQKNLVQHIQHVAEEGAKNGTMTKDKHALSELLSAIVCLPHVSTLDTSVRAKTLSAAWQQLKQHVSETSSSSMQDSLLYVMNKALVSLLVLRSDVNIHDLLPASDVLAVLRSHPSNYYVVHTADLYLTWMSDLNNDDFLTPDLLLEVYALLEPNLVSCSHKIRLSTLHLLTLFPVSVPVPVDQDSQEDKQWTVFTLALAAERVPLTVKDYRQRLMYLRKLDHSLVHTVMPAGPFTKMPMLYLMGTLLCPLMLLWEPVCELIATHAKGLDGFWQPFSPWLTVATSKAEESPAEENTNAANQETLLDKWLTQEQSAEWSADYHAFRNQLWRAMSLFPEKCEPKSKEFVPLFLLFLQKEYYQTDLTVAPTQDISVETAVNGKDDVDLDDTAADDGDDDDGEELPEVKGESTARNKGPGKVLRKSAVQSLLAHLELFTKMHNPRSLYKEEELRNIFFQFLEHKNSKVQKAAFQCIMTYRHKFLTPYRENFERLLDDKTFKTEVVLFSVDQENTEIRPEHRQELLPFLMRILHGKMLSKAGNETAGKRRSDMRRSIIFRFLGGCTPQEMQCFLDLVFGPFKTFITDDPVKMVKEALAVDLKKVIPPKRMKGVLGAVLVVADKLGHLLHDNTRSILHVLMGVAATCAGCQQHRDNIKGSAVTMLKSVRQMAFRHLIQFFADFDKFDFTEDESDAILDAFVWPQLERLTLESKCQPSLLLKLLQSWCQHPRHFHLLTKEAPGGEDFPLQAMFSLLNCGGVGRAVSTVILKAVKSLLEGEEDHEEGEQPPPHKRRKIVKESTVSQGVALVRPHVPALLTFIEGSVSAAGGQLEKNKKGGATNKDTILELKVLARVSLYLEDEQQAVRLCQLLVPFLCGSVTLQQDLEESMLESMVNLMKMVENPRSFFRPLVPLFISIERRQSRALLCQILKVIGSKVPELQEIADIVEKLNAWNPRQAEEPDYGVRLATFSSVVQSLKEWREVSVDHLLPLLYNCFFFIRNFDDLSLRDNSTFCVVTIVQRFKALTSDPDLYKEIVAETILPHVKKGLRSKQQAVRHEFLAVLQALVLAFPDHPHFRGLPGLHDTDIDSDFFENIRHIQLHKQAKALRRLSHYLHNHKLAADQHMGFFLPLLYSYVLDKTYAKSGKILDAAVDLTCMMCRQLPWENYYQLLRLFLSHLPRHLDNQRMIIRVIVAILDAFHFDLSQSQFRFSIRPKLKPESAADAKTEEDGGDQTQETTEAEEAEESLEVLAEASTSDEPTTVMGNSATFSADHRDMCAPGLATRIHRMVLTSLIPQLHKKLSEKVKSDDYHKLAQPKYAEDEEVLRVPLAMAMIKLLQKLPDRALDHKLPGIVMKVCNFLKSRAQDIRMTARDTLVKAVQSIGARYLPFIVKEMRTVLTRGYQMHVLSFSVHHLLKGITAILKPGDLDPALDDLQAIYNEELFGGVSEEKGVEGITNKLFEAKTIKGYLAYRIMAQYISPQYLGTLIHPLKEILERTHSQRVANKVRMILQSVTTGLLANTDLPLNTLMIFIHSLTQDNLPLLTEPKDTSGSESSGLPKPRKPESCLLIPKEMPRGGVKPKTSKKTTLDVLVEFGLVLLHSCLKSGRLQSDSAEHWGYLDPLVPSLISCLSLKYVRVNSAVLRCLEWLLPFPLPSLKERINRVARELFLLLKNYATAGAAKGDNQELVFTCFKAVTVLVREVKYHKLTKEHLQVLLTYCEEDIHDNTRQSTAFSVIKAILKRRLNVPELRELISTVETMSITVQAPHVRVQCREVVLQYLRDYPLGKKLQDHFGFYIRQLSYEHEDGRLSALKLLKAVFSSLDEEILQKYCGLFFLPLSICMFADEANACRDLAVSSMKTLLEKIDINSRDRLYSLVMTWLSDPKLSSCSMAVQLCGLFVEVETVSFTTRRQDVFPTLLQRDVTTSEESEQAQDRFYLQLMTLIRKVMGVGDLAALATWTDLNALLEFVQGHLLHNHSWVRLLTCRIMGQVLSSAGSDLTTYLPSNKAQKLVLTLCTQLQSPLLEEDLALQVMKNMATITRAYHQTSEGAGISALWIAKKLIKEANYESISNAPTTIKRTHVFKWLAFVSQEFDADVVESILSAVLPPLVREAENISTEETLKQLSQEVMDWLKRKVGVEVFSKAYALVQERRRETKERRKQKRAIDAVNNPEISAAKRMKKNKDRRKPVTRERIQRKKKTKLSVFH